MKINHSDKKQNSVKMKSMLIGLGGLLMLGIIFSIIQLTTAAPDWPTVGHPWVDMQCDTNMCVSVANSQVGIGSTGPASKLHVKDGHAWGSDLSIDATGTTGGRRWLLISSGGTAGEGQGKFMIKDNSAGVRMTIDTAGQVGIGEINPSYKLDVSGTGRFTGVLTLGTAGTQTSHAVRADRSISSGAGISGGGNLTVDRTLSLTNPSKSCSSGYAIRSFDLSSSNAPTCQAVGSLPTGSSGQTLRRGSSDWEASSVIQNDATNVGIGGSPSSGIKLNVHGTVRMTGFQLGTSATDGHVLTTNTSGVGTWQAPSSGGGSITCTRRVSSNQTIGAKSYKSFFTYCASGENVVSCGYALTGIHNWAIELEASVTSQSCYCLLYNDASFSSVTGYCVAMCCD